MRDPYEKILQMNSFRWAAEYRIRKVLLQKTGILEKTEIYNISK